MWTKPDEKCHISPKITYQEAFLDIILHCDNIVMTVYAHFIPNYIN